MIKTILTLLCADKYSPCFLVCLSVIAAALVLISPWVNLRCDAPSYTSNQHLDILPLRKLKYWSSLYLQGHDAADPLCSPLFASLHDLPPTLISAGGRELMFDDCIALAEKMQKQGGDVKLLVKEKLPHLWPLVIAYMQLLM